MSPHGQLRGQQRGSKLGYRRRFGQARTARWITVLSRYAFGPAQACFRTCLGFALLRMVSLT